MARSKRRYTPRDPAPPLEYRCGVCRRPFATLTLFDQHREQDTCFSIPAPREIVSLPAPRSELPRSRHNLQKPPRSPRPVVFVEDAIDLTGLSR